MPLGICIRCERAYIFGKQEAAHGESCPQCGRRLAVTSVRRMADMPPIPLFLPHAPELAEPPAREAATIR
jgi:DNA-directed RNA polymerase subunit RPC12/RpoP